MIYKFEDYRDFLDSLLKSRQGKNASYSLRSMARQMGIAPSSLSEILKRKKNLSLSRSKEVASKLGLAPTESKYFSLLVRYAHSDTHAGRRAIYRKIQESKPENLAIPESVDALNLMSSWYYIPILCLVDLTHFKLNPLNAAKHLGITKSQASKAIQDLERMGLLKKVNAEQWIRPKEDIFFKSDTAHEGLRRFHGQMLKLADKSLYTQTPQEKFVGSETIAIDLEDLPKAIQISRRYLAELVQLFDQGKNRTATYHIGVQAFNLSAKTFSGRQS